MSVYMSGRAGRRGLDDRGVCVCVKHMCSCVHMCVRGVCR